MNLEQLAEIAETLVANHKGILAADESTGTITKRLQAVGVESTEDNRRAYRNLLFTTDGVERYISGVIEYDETIRQRNYDDIPFPSHLARRGIIPGIKVDKGAKPLAGHSDEKVTEGLDGLRDRLKEYVELGAKFAKWRAVITIGENIPTRACLQANAHALARYAALCQESDLVPIVEPEVLMDGGHTLARCAAVTEATLGTVFDALYEQDVALEGMLLKPNMVIAGSECPEQADVEEVALATIRTLKRHVPAAVPGIVFLSGGQSPELATRHLNAINALGSQPWKLSFSYGRALQEPTLEAWRGARENIAPAQQAFRHRAKCNAAACSAQYNAALEAAA